MSDVNQNKSSSEGENVGAALQAAVVFGASDSLINENHESGKKLKKELFTQSDNELETQWTTEEESDEESVISLSSVRNISVAGQAVNQGGGRGSFETSLPPSFQSKNVSNDDTNNIANNEGDVSENEESDTEETDSETLDDNVSSDDNINNSSEAPTITPSRKK